MKDFTAREASNVVLGGIATSRLLPHTHMTETKSDRCRITDTNPVLFPAFDGCPDWVKPLMYVEYQVSTRGGSYQFRCCWLNTVCQAGFSEQWLCSLFGNLTEDLNVALRAALISTYIIQKHSMISAENSVFNSMRYAVGWLFGHNGEMEQVHIQIIRRE